MNRLMGGRGDEAVNRYNSHRGSIGSYRNSSSFEFGPHLQGFLGFVAEPGLRKRGIVEAYAILDDITSTAGDKIKRVNTISEEGNTKAETEQKHKHKSVEMGDKSYQSPFPRNYNYISLTTAVDTVIFINSKKGQASPAYWTGKIFEGLLSGVGKENKFKFLNRFFPVNETVSVSSCEAIISGMRNVLLDNFPRTGYVSFNVECNIHDSPDENKVYYWNNEDMIVLLEQTVCSINRDAYISLYQPSYLICIQVVNLVACLSVLPNAAKYHLYSLEEFNKY